MKLVSDSVLINVGESEGDPELPYKIDWSPPFADLCAVDDCLLELQECEIDYSGIASILLKSGVPKSDLPDITDSYYSCYLLIHKFPGIEISEQNAEEYLGDDWDEELCMGEDMPNPVVNVVVELQPNRRSEFLEFISTLLLEFRKLEHECGSQTQVLRPARQRGKQDLDETKKREDEKRAGVRQMERELEVQEWIRSTQDKIIRVLDEESGLVHIVPYLVNAESKEIFVISLNRSYARDREEKEVALTKRLGQKFAVFMVEEAYPAGTARIPYFAGDMRKYVMGWNQTKSMLIGDAATVVRATILRDSYNRKE